MAKIADKLLGKPIIDPGEVEVIELEDFKAFRVINVAARNLSDRSGAALTVFIEGRFVNPSLTGDPDDDYWFLAAMGNLDPFDNSERSFPSNAGTFFNMRSDDLAFDRLRLVFINHSQHPIPVAAYAGSKL